MQHVVYLVALLISLSGLGYLDYRRQLAWFYDRGRTLGTLSVMLAIFIAWDIAGLGLGIFSTNRHFVTGIYFGTPNLPLEEVLFLILVSYFCLILFRLGEKRS